MGHPDVVSFLTLDGKVASGSYVVDPNGPDRKKIVALTKVGSDERVLVHQRRIIPLPEKPMAVGLNNSGRVKLVCPHPGCRAEIKSDGVLAICPNHGPHEVILHGVKSMPDVTESESVTPEVAKPAKAPKKTSSQPALVDIAGLTQYGELWAKDVGFDHPAVGVRAYVLLADNPPRKLCVNTYDGSLGKKSKDPIAELGLVEFRDHTQTAAGTHVGHSLAKGLDAARKNLTKLRYSKVQ